MHDNQIEDRESEILFPTVYQLRRRVFIRFSYTNSPKLMFLNEYKFKLKAPTM